MNATRAARIADALYAIALIVVAALVLREAGKLAPAPYDPLGPKSFPIWISYGLIGLALAMLAQLLAGRDLGRAQQSMVLGLDEGVEHIRRPWIAVALFGLTVAYAAALSVRGIGFMFATGGYLFLSGFLLSRFERKQAPWIVLGAVGAAVVLDYVFRKIFTLDLP
jgi:hypothetical protein